MYTARKRRRSIVPILLLVALILVSALLVMVLVRFFGEFEADEPAPTLHLPIEEAASAPAIVEPETEPEYELVTPTRKLGEGVLVLVNGDHPYDFACQPRLVSIFDEMTDSYFVRDMEVLLAVEAMQPLNDFLDAFLAETGLGTINVVAGHRTLEYQQMLYDTSVESEGEEYTSRYVALPGSSEHHTGLAVDFSIFYEDTGLSDSFDGTGDYAWLLENAWKYGFVQRYPQGKQYITGIWHEPWHFRYVGIPHAKLMYENDWCLEEYMEQLAYHGYEDQHLTAEYEEQRWEVYYCPADQLYVPTTGEYDISGDNVSGYVVTVRLEE